MRSGMQGPPDHGLGAAGRKGGKAKDQHTPPEPDHERRRDKPQRKAAGPGERYLCERGDAQNDPLWNGKRPKDARRRQNTGRYLPMEEMNMYPVRKFDLVETAYSSSLRVKMSDAEEMIRRISPSRERSLALTKLDEALFWANAAIAAGSVMDHKE